MVLYSALRSAAVEFRAASRAVMSSSEATIRAFASRGIALRRPPPSISLTRISTDSSASKRTRLMSLFAFAIPLWISIPLWPPDPPLTVILRPVVPSLDVFSGSYVPIEVRSTPPAQPMLISSSSSVSKLSRMVASRCPALSPKAPVIPVSSSIVKRASRGG